MQTKNFMEPAYQKAVKKAWTNFINGLGDDDDYSMVRPEVYQSWIRSRDAKVNPHNIITKLLSPEDLYIKLNNSINLISIVKPYLERLYSFVEGSGAYIVVSDQKGLILNVIGDKEITYQGKTVSRLVPGAYRCESIGGTNAIGTALVLNRPIQLYGEEHFCEPHKLFSCSASPFYDENNNIAGVICVTLVKEYSHPHTLGMVVCAADSITRELRLKKVLSNVENLNQQRNLIIENMTSGVILLSPHGAIFQINSLALNMLGLTSGETIGHNLSDLIFIDNSSPTNLSDFLNKEKYNVDVNITVYIHSMKVKQFNASVNHIKDATGEITAILLRINKPEIINKLVKRIEGYHATYTFDDIIGESKSITDMKKYGIKAAETDSNVLILGASGTGKELIAQSIHNASVFSNGPFVAVNCAAIPNNLVESELFGYEKGAFTGAASEGRPGKFELANGGTIFLDEIGDMPLDIQATLLRVIQTREVIRIGGNYPKQINIRIIAATNQNLEKAVEEKAFRSDLYYRLNVFTITSPTLATRGANDIRLLTDYFVNSYNISKGRNITISSEVYSILESYHWPGNIRELENVIERAINLSDNSTITLDVLPLQVRRLESSIDSTIFYENSSQNHHTHIQSTAASSSMPTATDSEKALIISSLQHHNGSVTKVSQALDINRRTLYRKMAKLSIDPTTYRNR